MAPSSEKPWYSEPADDCLNRLASSELGLSDADVISRQQQYGRNQLPAAKSASPFKRLLRQLNSVLILVLITAAVITAFWEHWLDSYVILIVVVVNTVVGFIQEGKAEQALQAIAHMLAPNAIVLRNGKRREIPAAEVVPGDLMILAAGDRVAADLRLLQAKNLQIQEAVLTGESLPVEKDTTDVAENTPLGDRSCMAYSGTLVSRGHGLGLVVATGRYTEIGRISGLMTNVEQLSTPLLQQMTHFSRWLTLVIIVFAGLIFAYGTFLQQTAAAEMFITVIGFAVAAIPEGLPAILTITLAIGVQGMAGRKAIIRRLPVVETLGAVSVICSDKTGTLTRNEMTVTELVTADNAFNFTGVGYEPTGSLQIDNQPVNLDITPTVTTLIRSAALCNDASLHHQQGQWQMTGDPMEVAILVSAIKVDMQPEELQGQFPRHDVIPFDAQHCLMATLHHDHEQHHFIIVKGAPEQLLADCQWQQTAEGEREPLETEYWHQQMQKLASQGQRVLAVAIKNTNAEQITLNFTDLEDDLVLLGLLGFMDPPREEAVKAIADCTAAGIQVKMITGDHAVTASAIAAQLGLNNPDAVITGNELDELSEADLIQRIDNTSVFARTSPEHKLRLVSALQSQQHIVAMTGDGVNDAPALKRADVGIAMGKSGTEAAKEAAEMVLADDNFASIVRAVSEGRTVYDNLKKAILFLLPINGGESLSIIAALLAGLTLPISAIQILWVNMVSSVALSMALAFEPAEENAMQRQPRQRDEKMLSGLLIWRICLVSVLFLAGIFGIFVWSQSQGASLEQSRTYAVNTLVMMEVFYLFNVRCLNVASWSIRQWFTSRIAWLSLSLVVLLQLAFTYLPVMQDLFSSQSVSLRYWLIIGAIGVVVYMLLELEKSLRRWLVNN
ncbi:MAG: HAD-IC family P-type ATPase [Methylophaga sp.]|nr:HAD-IC family P-type ATPase [Methylophaga sp.]